MGAKANLIKAIKKGNINEINDLLSKTGFFSKINVNKLIDGETLIHIAIKSKQIESLEVLISRKADLNKSNLNGQTPLLLAIKLKFNEIVHYLIKNDADINKSAPLSFAVENGDFELVKMLIEAGADFKTGEITETPLCKASEKGYYNIVSYLLEKGAKPDGACLTLSSMYGHRKIVKLFIDLGINVNDGYAYSFSGRKSPFFPLPCAISEGHLEVVQLLVEAGADINLKDEYDHSPLDISRLRKHKKVEDYLLSMGAN